MTRISLVAVATLAAASLFDAPPGSIERTRVAAPAKGAPMSAVHAFERGCARRALTFLKCLLLIGVAPWIAVADDSLSTSLYVLRSLRDFSAHGAPRTRSIFAPYERYIGEASLETGVPESLIRAVISCESNGDPTAVSRAGAIGLMQLLVSTAQSVGVVDIWNPREQVLGGARYLARQHARFAGDWPTAIRAYHQGPRRTAAGKAGPETLAHSRCVHRRWGIEARIEQRNVERMISQ